MSNEDPIEQLVVCRPAGPHRHNEDLFKNLFVYTGSTQGACSECGTPVWIGPRSLAYIQNGPAKPICDDCLVDFLAEGNAPRGVIELGNPERRS